LDNDSFEQDTSEEYDEEQQDIAEMLHDLMFTNPIIPDTISNEAEESDESKMVILIQGNQNKHKIMRCRNK